LGAAAGILAGVLVAYFVLNFTEHGSAAASIGLKVAGTSFVIATFAAGRLAVDRRFKKDWFVRGFLAGATIPCFLIGLIFLLYSGW